MFTDDEAALNDAESLLTKGVIDSVGALEITQFIEETFNIKVREDEMLPENLDSVDNIVAFVQRKQSVSSQPTCPGNP
jgi:acyl carrier protein